MSHVRDPIELVLEDLEYLRARLESIRDMARHPEQARPNMLNLDVRAYALGFIDAECGFLIDRVNQTRKVLDPEIRS